MLIDFKDEDFDSKIKNDNVSIILFSAIWCSPCKVYKPILEKVSDEYKDKANFYYADIEDSAINTASQAGIRGVPTVIIYRKGQEVDRKVGGVPEGNMREFLDNSIQFNFKTSDAKYKDPVMINTSFLFNGIDLIASSILFLY